MRTITRVHPRAAGCIITHQTDARGGSDGEGGQREGGEDERDARAGRAWGGVRGALLRRDPALSGRGGRAAGGRSAAGVQDAGGAAGERAGAAPAGGGAGGAGVGPEGPRGAACRGREAAADGEPARGRAVDRVTGGVYLAAGAAAKGLPHLH